MGLSLRAYQPSDEAAVVALLQRIDGVDGLVEMARPERWRDFLSIAHVKGGRDFHVAEREGVLVGLVTSFQVSGARRVRVYVDPTERRRGMGSALFDVAEAQCRAEGTTVIDSFVHASWTAGCAFARAKGFDVLVRDLFMRRGTQPFELAAPANVRVRPYVLGADDVACVEVANESLANDLGFHPETVESLRSYAAADGTALWLAEVDGAVVGFCHVQARGDVGYVHALGVRRAWEGRGIGGALLARGIETLRAAEGVRLIELCTEGPNVRAQRLYVRAGFSVHREAFSLRKRIV